MRRRRTRKAALGVQLFPFLAVLLCTLGALIVLLVMVVQQAHVSAEVVQNQTDKPTVVQQVDTEKLRESIEDDEWRQSELEKSRSEVTKQLANQRLELSHLEDHIRRLEKRWKELEAEARQLTTVGQDKGHDAEAARRELAELEHAIQLAKESLETARNQSAQRKRTFAIVPYDGPNGTRRRPIYIECSEESIVIQPEGVILRPEDFIGRISAGNPLDAALRATREYLARNGDATVHGEPYPLLVVRPNGAVAYAAARAAMKSWEDEFGYELVDQDIKLAYPPADPALGEELHRAVEEARQRQAILASAMPTQYRRANGGFAPSAGGGFVLEEEDFGDWEAPKGSRRANVSGGRSSSQNGSQFTGQAGSGQFAGTNRSAGRTTKSGSSKFDEQSSQGSLRSKGGTGEDSPENGDRVSGRQSMAAGKPGGASFGSSPKPGPLARQRGANWGTPGASRGLTGITRPIPVVCLPDRLVVLPDRGESGSPDVTLLPESTVEKIDDFVGTVKKRVDSWGLAVVGGYWKPVLSVQVAPGGEPRFADLQILLENSGFEVKRKTP